MSKQSWVANPEIIREKARDILVRLVNGVEQKYGERYLTMSSKEIEEATDKIIKLLAPQAKDVEK